MENHIIPLIYSPNFNRVMPHRKSYYLKTQYIVIMSSTYSDVKMHFESITTIFVMIKWLNQCDFT